MIDRIEFHVSSALEYVEEAVKDTKKAMEYQRKARRVRRAFASCLVFVKTFLLISCQLLSSLCTHTTVYPAANTRPAKKRAVPNRL